MLHNHFTLFLVRGGGGLEKPSYKGGNQCLTLLVAGGLFLSTSPVFLKYLPNGLS